MRATPPAPRVKGPALTMIGTIAASNRVRVAGTAQPCSVAMASAMQRGIATAPSTAGALATDTTRSLGVPT